MFITPYATKDLSSVVALLQAALSTEPITEASFARRVLLDPNFDSNGAFVAREATGAIIGFLLALTRRRPLEDGPVESDRGWITLFAVAEAARRQGVGSALLMAAEAWLREQDRKTAWISPYAPNYWTPGVDEKTYATGLAFLRKRDYTTASRPLSMEASLAGGWCVPAWAAERTRQLNATGVQIETFTPQAILPLTEFLRHEFPGDWQRYVRETMLEIVSGRRLAEDLWLAREDERVLGFAQHEGERFGPFGVASSARGRGVGAALLFQTLDSMRRRGLHNAWFLWTDDATADRLYRAAGFREARRYAILRKNLLP